MMKAASCSRSSSQLTIALGNTDCSRAIILMFPFLSGNLTTLSLVFFKAYLDLKFLQNLPNHSLWELLMSFSTCMSLDPFIARWIHRKKISSPYGTTTSNFLHVYCQVTCSYQSSSIPYNPTSRSSCIFSVFLYKILYLIDYLILAVCRLGTFVQ